MLAAPVPDTIPLRRPHPVRGAAVALSAVLHLVLVLAWLGFPLPPPRPEETAISVEIAPEPPPPPQGEGKKGQSEPAGGDAKAIPQLEEGVLARRSSPPRDKPAAPDAAPSARPAEKPEKPAPVTRNERDFVLSQVLRHWRPPPELSAYDRGEVGVSVEVGADGYFTGLYDARRPWNPAEVFDGYGALPPQAIQRRTIDAFYQAIRKAQPLRLPPQLKAKAPFPVRLDFRFKDVR
jgi:hypothetical protein